MQLEVLGNFGKSSFVGKDKIILKYIGKGKVTRIVKTILKKEKKKNHMGRLTLPDFNIYYMYICICLLCSVNNIDQWKKIENPEIDPQKYAQLVFDKGTKAMR